MVKGTRKVKKTGKIMTIPSLRKSFDQIEDWVSNHLRTMSVKDISAAFRLQWKKVFGREISEKAAEAYLYLKQKTTGTRRARGLGKKQLGGSYAATPIAGAPLDYQTAPGVYGPYGNFPAYVSSGLTAYNQFNQDSISQQCGQVDSTPNVPISMGSNIVGMKGGASRRSRARSRKGKSTRKANKKGKTRGRRQRGGAISDMLSTMLNRPYMGNVPQTTGFVYQQALRGQNVAAEKPQDFTVARQQYLPNVIPAGVSSNQNLTQTLTPYFASLK